MLRVDSFVFEFQQFVQLVHKLIEFVWVSLCGNSLAEYGHAFSLVGSHG